MRGPLALLCGLAGCGSLDGLGLAEASDELRYDGVETRLLDEELVNIVVSTSGATSIAAVTQYAECAAAQYTLVRGYAFTRPVRVTLTNEPRGLGADTVYIVSPDLPRGPATIDAEVVVADCEASGIPTV